MFWNEKVQISDQMYKNCKEIIRFLRMFGLFPLATIRKGSKLFFKWSPWYALYGYAFGTAVIFMTFYGLLDDILSSKENSIKVISSTDKYVLTASATGYSLNVVSGIFIMPFYFLHLFAYIRIINQVDSIIGTTYTKRDKYTSLLVLTSALAYESMIIVLDDYMGYVVRGMQIGWIGVITRTLALDFTVYTTLSVEYTSRHMAWSLEKRFTTLNTLLEMEYGTKKKSSFKDAWKSIENNKSMGRGEESIVYLRDAYLKLMDAMRVLDGFFGINTLMALLSSLFCLVTSPYFLILVLEGKRRGTIELVPKFFMFWLHVIRVLLITEPWYSCSLQIKETKRLVLELFLLNRSQKYRKQVGRFSMVFCLCDQKFSACGFFDVDRFLFTSMIGHVTTYLVILLQAQAQDKS